MYNCSLQNTAKAVLTNKQTLAQMIPMVSEVLCGMDLETTSVDSLAAFLSGS